MGYKIKEQIEWHGFIYKLFVTEEPKDLSYNSESNIFAFDVSGSLRWKAEGPISHYDEYFTMKVDRDRGVLVAVTVLGFMCIIDLSDGKLMESKLIK